MLIIVIVALNWSLIEHGFADDTHLAGEEACLPTRLDFNRATMSTIVTTETMQIHHVQSREDDALDAETKQCSAVIV